MKAAYPGWCHLCDDRIRPGDDIRSDHDHPDDSYGTWAHVDCLTRSEAAPPWVAAQLAARPRCPACADLLAADGSCGNCS